MTTKAKTTKASTSQYFLEQQPLRDGWFYVRYQGEKVKAYRQTCGCIFHAITMATLKYCASCKAKFPRATEKIVDPPKIGGIRRDRRKR